MWEFKITFGSIIWRFCLVLFQLKKPSRKLQNVIVKSKYLNKFSIYCHLSDFLFLTYVGFYLEWMENRTLWSAVWPCLWKTLYKSIADSACPCQGDRGNFEATWCPITAATSLDRDRESHCKVLSLKLGKSITKVIQSLSLNRDHLLLKY